MLESAIQAKIIKWLKTRPNSVTYKHLPYPSGIPDIVHYENTKVYFFEVKRTVKDKPRPIQKYRMGQLKKAGIFTKVVRSLEEVKQVFKV